MELSWFGKWGATLEVTTDIFSIVPYFACVASANVFYDMKDYSAIDMQE
tara:strand:- start:1593 stop:1739 length:147 start_codon:yes stop_codon:yes gene_type:complete